MKVTFFVLPAAKFSGRKDWRRDWDELLSRKSINNNKKVRTSLKAATTIRSVAETFAFLLSDKAESITAQSVNVDNGTI